jgi:hypothetical protein
MMVSKCDSRECRKLHNTDHNYCESHEVFSRSFH